MLLTPCVSGFKFRLLAGYALPLAVGHADPGVGPAFAAIDLGTVSINTFACPCARRDGDVSEDRDLHVTDPVVLPFAPFQAGEESLFAGDPGIGIGIDEVIGEERGDHGGLAEFLGIGPFLLEVSNGFLNVVILRDSRRSA